jgi:hypothetical protein
MKVCMVNIINIKINLMQVDKETLEGEEVMQVMMKVIEVNNQIMT